jgi:hypothetical protein
MTPEDVHPERLSGGTDCAAQLTGQAACGHVTRLHVTLHVVAPVRGEAAVETAVAARLCISISYSIAQFFSTVANSYQYFLRPA